MPLSKITCPHCRVTLRPNRPIPEGKAVKCPKCLGSFQAGEDQAEVKTARKKSSQDESLPMAEAVEAAPAEYQDSDSGTYAVIQDPDEKTEEKSPKKKRTKRGDEDEGEEDEEEEEEEEDRDDDVVQMYLKSLKTKDPRGVAQAAVVSPSNWMLRSALIGFFGWMITLVVFMIPVAFPNIPEGKGTEKDADYQALRKKEMDKAKGEATKKPAEKGLFEVILEYPLLIATFVATLLLGFVHAALLGIGAVKMQSLESWGWSLTGSILAIFPPMHLAPLSGFLYWFLVFCDAEGAVFLCQIVYLFGPLIGVYCITVLRRPEVVAGFTFHPD